MLRRLAIALALCFAASAVPVLAAEPGEGTVSAASPKAEWTGEAAGYGTSIVADVNGSFFGPCQAPNCDQYTLQVADSADLVVALTTNDGSGFMTAEVEKPDGTIVYDGGAEGADTTTFKIKKAAPGTYLVRSQTNNTVADDYGYHGTATLAVAGAAPVMAPVTPVPAAPAPASPPPATLSIGTRSASARRLKGTLRIAVASDQPVTGVVATLAKGTKKVATARLASLSGKRTLKLKVARRIRPGRYTLSVSAKDERGAIVGASAPFKLKR
jgi:hypothetical protein